MIEIKQYINYLEHNFLFGLQKLLDASPIHTLLHTLSNPFSSFFINRSLGQVTRCARLMAGMSPVILDLHDLWGNLLTSHGEHGLTTASDASSGFPLLGLRCVMSTAMATEYPVKYIGLRPTTCTRCLSSIRVFRSLIVKLASESSFLVRLPIFPLMGWHSKRNRTFFCEVCCGHVKFWWERLIYKLCLIKYVEFGIAIL